MPGVTGSLWEGLTRATGVLAAVVLLALAALLWSARPAEASPLVIVDGDLLEIVEDPLLPPPAGAPSDQPPSDRRGADQRDLSDLLGDLLPFLDPGPPPPAPDEPPPGPPPSPDPEPPDPDPAPEPEPDEPRRGKQALGRGSVGTVLDRARSRRAISASERRAMGRTITRARKTRSRLGGRRQRELSRVIVDVERLAARGRLTTGRLEVAFLQVKRNAEYWSDHATARNGQRVAFRGSPIIFQYFPGQGLQFHPLANFGKANALYNQCVSGDGPCRRNALRTYLDELAALGSTRGGGFLTWEYFFRFGGGSPPWTSGMSQGTALQAFSRSARLLDEPRYERYAGATLGAFSKRPGNGVRVDSSGGRHYLLYSYDRRLRVLNGHLQSVIGLFDHARASDSTRARDLYRAGSRSALRELRRYDLGNWSRYAQGGGRASREYHELVTVFLERLCERTEHRTYCTYAKRFRGYL
ncbi:MAG: D-glucuronyl C5-epimerase family protein [Solirubrobacteraceae bacterium MAG38_C4-C5]|nr:D-glucuronyl C5-epimerase family protein [Candidatus Siliceabacter maunaloa]